MRHFSHSSEDELIAYQMGEMGAVEAAAVREHLEACAACAGAAEQIAETLRVFSAEPVATPDVEHAWQRMRGSLPGLAMPARRRAGWRWAAAAGLVACLVACLVAGLAVMRVHREKAQEAELPVGPLSVAPRDPGLAARRDSGLAARRDSGLAAHLGQAERLLTELRHQPAGQPLDAGTRAEAEAFRGTNAVWVRRSREAGDGAEASVLEGVDRTLTTLAHEPGRAAGRIEDKGWHVRFEMSTDGLLLDLRVLEQNDAQGKE